MEWVKLAAVPAYYIDGALLRAGESAEILFCRGLAHCGGVESKGVIDKTVLPMLVHTKVQARADALVREGLWLDEGTHYRIRSWDKWQDQHDVAAEKRRKDRERQREHRRKASLAESRDQSQPLSRDSHSDIRDCHDVDVEGEREGETEPTPTELVAPRKRVATPRKHRLPEDFPITPQMVEWAREATPLVDGRHETEQWRDYHLHKGDTGTDWARSWQTWMRRAQKDAERTGGRSQLALVRPNASEQRTLANIALIEQMRQQEAGA